MDSYTFKYVSTGTGTMDVTIEENNKSNDCPRIVKHVGVPLAEGVSYKSSDDMASSGNSYELEAVENSSILKPSFDSADNVSMKYKLSVSNGFLLDDGQFGIEGDFLAGEKVPIYASVPKGYVFKEWVSDAEAVFEKASASSSTVIMPNYAVAITATCEPIKDDNGNSGNTQKPSGNGTGDTDNKLIAKKMTLSKTSYVYNGKAKKPAVTVIDNKGNKISSTYYTVSYRNNKKVGKATVTVKLKNGYSGTLNKNFIIKPKGTKLISLTGKSKSISIKWAKQKTQTNGYQIQYSTSSKFSKKATVTKAVKKNMITKLIAKKLKAKKTYYVRIRAYKTVNGKKYYSAWSKVKKVKTKK